VDVGVFLLAGSLVHKSPLPDLQTRVNDDPFVAESIVSAEVLELDRARADERLQFLIL
jgi:hypothetical protein